MKTMKTMKTMKAVKVLNKWMQKIEAENYYKGFNVKKNTKEEKAVKQLLKEYYNLKEHIIEIENENISLYIKDDNKQVYVNLLEHKIISEEEETDSSIELLQNQIDDLQEDNTTSEDAIYLHIKEQILKIGKVNSELQRTKEYLKALREDREVDVNRFNELREEVKTLKRIATKLNQ